MRFRNQTEGGGFERDRYFDPSLRRASQSTAFFNRVGNGPSLYDLLGLDPKATADEIRRAYLEKAKALHPDHHRGNAAMEEAFKAISAGAEILLDPVKRARYDNREIDAYGNPASGGAKKTFARRRVFVASFGAGLVLAFCLIAAMTRWPHSKSKLVAEVLESVQMPQPKGLNVDRPAQERLTPPNVIGDENASEAGQKPSGSLTAIPVEAAKRAPWRFHRRQSAAAAPAAAQQDAPARDSAGASPAEKDAALPSMTDGEITAADRNANNAGLEAKSRAGEEDGADVRDTAFHLKRAIGFYGDREYARALAECDEALSISPRSAAVLVNRGNIWDELGEPARALTDYDQALGIEPGNALIYYNRGILWRRTGEFDRALADFDQAIRASFTDAAIYNDRGLVWYEKRQYDRALADFDRAIAIEPHFAAAHHHRGLALAAKPRLLEALSSYTRAIELGSGAPGLRGNRGWTYHLLGRDKEALQDLSTAIELNPRVADAYHKRAAIYAKLNEAEKAREDQEAASKLEVAAVKAQVPPAHRPFALISQSDAE
jgi:tetratricopeptide (TPR) repeat protein